MSVPKIVEIGTFQDTIVPGICRKTSQQRIRVYFRRNFAFLCSPSLFSTVTTRLEPPIWSHDTSQQIPCFDSCQLIITWMSNINDVLMVMALLSCICSYGTLRTDGQPVTKNKISDRCVTKYSYVQELCYKFVVLYRSLNVYFSTRTITWVLTPSTYPLFIQITMQQQQQQQQQQQL